MITLSTFPSFLVFLLLRAALCDTLHIKVFRKYGRSRAVALSLSASITKCQPRDGNRHEAHSGSNTEKAKWRRRSNPLRSRSRLIKFWILPERKREGDAHLCSENGCKTVGDDSQFSLPSIAVDGDVLLEFACPRDLTTKRPKSSTEKRQIDTRHTNGCRTQPGQRQTVKNEEYYCHAHNRDGLVGIAFADGEYPARAGFGVVNKILDEFSDTSGNKWRTISEDSTDALPILEPALQKYQV